MGRDESVIVGLNTDLIYLRQNKEFVPALHLLFPGVAVLDKKENIIPI